MRSVSAVIVRRLLKQCCLLLLVLLATPFFLRAEGSAPLKLIQSIPSRA